VALRLGQGNAPGFTRIPYQTSDVTITRRIMRRVVLLHAVLSFAFNTTILALLINVILGNLE